MNFYVNSQGQIIRVDPEDVFQGSVNANTINFIGAFPSTCPVTVAFRLPTGEWTTPASMGMNSDSPLPGIQQPDGTQFNIWRYTIPGSVTEHYGTVNLQFYVYAQGSDGNGNTIATAASSFEVKKGVPVVLPDPSDDYETLLTQILSALQQLQQADSEGALAAQESAEAAANSASAAASSATAASNSATIAQTNAHSAKINAQTAVSAAARAKDSETAAQAAQAAAESAQAGAEQAKDDAQDLVNEAQDIAETTAQETAQETAQNVVNNFVQTGGPFTNGIIVDKQITLRGNPETDTSESVLQHKEYGFNFYDVEEGTDLSGKSLFFDTGITPLDDSNFTGTSLETLISFQNGYTLYVNPNVSPSNYSVYMSTPSGGISYFYLNGQWMTDVYTFTGSGWVVSSVKKENFESDAAQMLADMLVVGTFFVPSRTRFDDGAQIPLTPLGAFDVANKQYVDGTVKTEAGYLQQAIDNEASARAAADTALRNSKYDKTGGTISGNVQITGDLTVQGTTTTNDTETLAVKDNLIVTNSDGATLSGLSGLIIRTSPTQSYGIVYDPANEGTVKLGLGTYNADTGAFTFATGEGLPVAVRALSTAWTNLHLAAWDAANNQFVDAGKAVADFQEKLTFDTTPTQNSTNPVTSGGVYSALQGKQDTLTAGEGISIDDGVISATGTEIPDIPEPTGADAGKVLAVNSAGNGYELVEQSGGTIEYMTDAEVDALFINITTFANTSWKDIDIVSRAGLAEDYFAVGDEKTIELTTGEQITLVILGFNHDDLSDGSGKAGITIGMKELLATTYRMNATRTNAGGWDESNMRTSTMATLLSRLPSDLQAVIKQVNKKTTDGNGSSSITTSADKLWLPSMVEIIGTTMAGYAEEGEQYEYWQTVKDGTVEADRIKRLSNGTGDAKVWWLRSPQINSTYYWYQIDYAGFLVLGSPTSLWGVCFAFCV